MLRVFFLSLSLSLLFLPIASYIYLSSSLLSPRLRRNNDFRHRGNSRNNDFAESRFTGLNTPGIFFPKILPKTADYTFPSCTTSPRPAPPESALLPPVNFSAFPNKFPRHICRAYPQLCGARATIRSLLRDWLIG